MDLRSRIRNIPDFPKPGIVFRDITPLLLHDDLLATGGTARALTELAEGAGAVIAGCAFLVELSFLGGRDKLAPYDVHALVSYDSE